MAGVASDDIGRLVLNVLRRPEDTIGRTIPAVSAILTGEQMAEDLTTALGEPVAYRPLTAAQLRSFGFPGADELGNMFQYYAEFSDAYNGRRDVDAARALNPEPASLASFLTAHQDQLAR